MVDVDLLDGFTFGPTITPDVVNNDYFTQHFWWNTTKNGLLQEMQGEKNHGFNVLYHNMKHGQISVKYLQDFIRESANSEDLYAKHLTKLAKQAANSSTLGSFAPMFEVFKVMAEKLSSCHMDVVHKLHDIIKDLSKYLEEQKGKHRQVKEELSGTELAMNHIQTTTAAVLKSKEKYHQQCVEAERLKKAGALPKDVEKAEVKTRKSSEEYKNLVEKYSTVRSDFEQKMTDSAKRFQEIEVAHLKHMKSVLDSYILSFENANVLIGQVHQEFRRQVDENTIESLIKQYSESKGTGTDRPGPIIFEECDVNSMLVTLETAHTNGVTGEDGAIPPQNKPSRRLPFMRRKPRSTKASKDNTSTNSKDTDKDNESMESPDKDNNFTIDEDGFTVRPETPKDPHMSGHSWHESSDSDDSSDSDYNMTRKIHVKINPKDQKTEATSNLDTLNAVSRNLMLNSPTPLGGKRLTPINGGGKKTKVTSPVKSEKSLSDELMDLFGGSSSVPTAAAVSSANDNIDNLANLFGGNAPESPATVAKNDHPASTTAPIPQSSSNVSLNNLFIMPSDKENDKELCDITNDSKPDEEMNSPSQSSVNSIEMNAPTTRPNKLTLTSAWPETSKASSSQSAPLASSESWSSLSSFGGTPMDSFASSRGPSPLTLMHGDPIPIAVAFTENVNAYFKGENSEKCILKIMGDVQISFPAGIIRAFTSNPNPSVLSFKVKGASKIQQFVPNQNLLFTDSSQADAAEHLFWFDMSTLTSQIKKMSESNPNSLYYNIPVLKYQMTSQEGHEIAPLHLTSCWKCEAESTDITVEYKYNSKCTSSVLKNMQIIVPVNGGVTSAQSVPTATWSSSLSRLTWKITSPVSSSTPPGTLKSKLSLTSGPSNSSTLAVQFVSEGSTLTGSDFELTGSGYRVSLVKKRFVSGKYLLDSN